MNFINRSVLVALIGVTLFVVLSVDATLHDEEHKGLMRNGEKLSKRAADDAAPDDKTPAPKRKGKKKGKGTDAPNGSTTTSAPDGGSSTTTGAPTAKSSKKSTTTTGKPDDDNDTPTPKSSSKNAQDPDEYYMNKLVKDQGEEKTLITKANQALKDWLGWMEAHDRKTLNKNRANYYVMAVKQAEMRYLRRRKSSYGSRYDTQSRSGMNAMPI